MNERVEILVPHENVNDPTAKLLEWKVRAGGTVKAGEAIAEMENSKATFSVNAPVAGTIEHARKLGEEVPVGAVLGYVLRETAAGAGEAVPASRPTESAGNSSSGATASPSVQGNASAHAQKVHATTPTPTDAPAGVLFSKGAQLLLTELGLDPRLFAGMTFVKEADVRQKAGLAAAPGPEPKLQSASTATGAPALSIGHTALRPPAMPKDEEIAERIPLERAKLVENRELLAADRAALKSTLFYFCPAGGLQAACARRTPPLPRLVVILFETARLLHKLRGLNACLADDQSLLYRHVHLGFAVDMGRGLKVLVIRKADELSFAELTEKFDELLVKYSTDTLAVAEVTGSTFTVTDLGQEGVFGFVPLLNTNQAAILGLGSEEERSGGFILSCSFDHRLTGGRQVAEFLRELSRRIACHADSLGASAREGNGLHCSRCLQTAEDLRAIRGFLLPSVEPPGYICTNCLSGD